MKRFLLPLLAALALPTACSNAEFSDITVNAKIDPKIRKACLPAADFEGCVRSYTKSTKKVKVREFDLLGQPVIPNWIKIENPADKTVFYHNKLIKKVNARGEFGRYIGFDYLIRWYQEPQAGTSGYSTTIGPSYTNCSGVNTTYGSTIGCTTTPGTTINIPGRSAVPGGVKQEKYITIIDCFEGTHKSFPSGRNKRWLSLTKSNSYATSVASVHCHRISSLPPSNFQKFVKGKPTKKDIEARNTLSTRTELFKAGGFTYTHNEFIETYVHSVFYNSPAYKAGLLAGDQIVKVNNIALTGLSGDQVYKLTQVEKYVLTIERDGEIKNIPITRGLVTRFKLTKS